MATNYDAKEDHDHFAEYIEERFREVYRDPETADRIDCLRLGEMAFEFLPEHVHVKFSESRGRGFWDYDVDAHLVSYDKTGTVWNCNYTAEYTEEEN